MTTQLTEATAREITQSWHTMQLHRRPFAAAMARFLEQVHSACRGSQADYELARTDEPLDAPLRKLLTARLRRRG